jgi:hypothetical protein
MDVAVSPKPHPLVPGRDASTTDEADLRRAAKANGVDDVRDERESGHAPMLARLRRSLVTVR